LAPNVSFDTQSNARVHGLDLAPPLIGHAKTNAALADVEIDFREGDVEGLPYDNASLDVVLSQFGPTFAPRFAPRPKWRLRQCCAS
jgi:ubiquinone/menaquinone biosynthesis C-methylase UbiE